MRVAVMGAGAVGCYYGGVLARAGHEVVLVGRQAHVDAINTNGLLVETSDFKAYVPAKATVDAASLEEPELILFSVKSADTEAAGRALLPVLRPQTHVLSLQNGVDNASRLAAATGHAVIPAVVYVGTEMAGPGHVRHHGGGQLVIGKSSESEPLAKLLSEAQIPTTVSDDIDATLWGKLIVNCAYNAMSAVAGISYGRMVAVEGARDVIESVVDECGSVARACGVTIPDDMMSRTMAVATRMPDQLSSTAQDLARGKPSEIDFLNGYVVRLGREHGIATPTNQALVVMVKLAETARGVRG